MRELQGRHLRYSLQWKNRARLEQLPPPGDWRIWLFLGGRGAGKTRAGAEWIATGAAEKTMHRIGLIGATFNDARQVMIEGPSGLKTIAPHVSFEPSNRRVLFPGGAIATVLSADEPDSLRGHQFDAIWGDEFAKWPDAQGALDMALMTLRLGKQPRMLLTTTPRSIAAVKQLLVMDEVAKTHSTTRDNAANLAKGFVAAMERRYGKTRLGRQELDAELIEDNDAASWKRAWIEAARVAAAPPLAEIVVAVDPPASKRGAACGIVIAGRDGPVSDAAQGYVLADFTLDKASPREWSTKVVEAFERFDADVVVAEKNQGGDMVSDVLKRDAPNLPVRLVTATRDKLTRAAPAALLYESGRIHHVGGLPALEDELCTYDGTGKSPDRMDALVWALSHLFPLRAPPEPKVRTI